MTQAEYDAEIERIINANLPAVETIEQVANTRAKRIETMRATMSQTELLCSVEYMELTGRY